MYENISHGQHLTSHILVSGLSPRRIKTQSPASGSREAPQMTGKESCRRGEQDGRSIHTDVESG